MLPLALGFGIVTALANLAGALLAVLHRSPRPGLVVASLGFGGGFLLTAALLEVMPAALANGPVAPAFVMLGYGIVYVAEQLFAGHAHEEPGGRHLPVQDVSRPTEHLLAQEFRHRVLPITRHASLAALVGLNIHDFVDGLAIGAGVITSEALGVLLFLAVLVHEVPAGFVIASVMRGGGYGRGPAFLAGISIGVITLVGIAVPFLFSGFDNTLTTVFLALSAGTFIYVAATDLIPAAAGGSRHAYLYVLLGAVAFYMSTLLLESAGLA
ncbi:MAG: ZIP family metal transporter [Chloroflexi bacterium]|nr:ZIP family metal transporter [Chloroflexota bacterium]